METVNSRLKEFYLSKKLSQEEFSNKIGASQQYISAVVNNKKVLGPKVINKVKLAFPDLDLHWLLNGGDMAKASESNVVKPETVVLKEEFENNNGNRFVELPGGKYYMLMPLANFKIQAGFLDHYQDVDFLMDMEQHGMWVDKPVQGRYVAFTVSGDSMDDGTINAIPRNSIVSTRELQRHHWKDKLRYRDFPYWVIYTKQNKMPLLKEIVDHDVTNGTIQCHSLNDSPEFEDFTLPLNDIQAMFYVIDVTKNVSKKLTY